MAHQSQMEFFAIVQRYFASHFAGAVIDVGSMDINGGPHQSLNSTKYVGVDLGPGPNVDVVSRGEDLSFETGSFDAAMSSECFEHNPNWQPTLHNMIRMTKQGGVVAISCATTGRKEHGTTASDDGGYSAPLAVAAGQEHYANVTPKQVRRALKGSQLQEFFIVIHKPTPDLLFVGVKEGASPQTLSMLRECQAEVDCTFGAAKTYPGRFYVRHSLITLLGDRGTRLYERGHSLRERSFW